MGCKLIDLLSGSLVNGAPWHRMCRNRTSWAMALGVSVAATGCAMGTMQVQELHYFAVSNGSNTNYFRLRIDGTTKLGDTQYRSGWFPARSVDQLFGKIDESGGVSELETRAKIESAINDKVLSTTQAWLAEAASDSPDTSRLNRLMLARRRVLAYPSPVGAPYPGNVEIEYNPAKGVFLRFSDEKLVFVLSANPDDVIGKIANFAESDNSALAIQQLANVVASRGRADVASREATETVRKKVGALVGTQISLAIAAVKDDTTSKQTAIQQVTSLITLLGAVP